MVRTLMLSVLLIGCGTPIGQPAPSVSEFSNAPADGIQISKVSAVSREWVELHNPSSAHVSLAGFQLADSDRAGDPRHQRALRFPDGVIIAPGGFLWIVAGKNRTSTEVETECALKGVVQCLHVEWRIDSSEREQVHLLDPSGAPVATALPPAGDGLVVPTVPEKRRGDLGHASI